MPDTSNSGVMTAPTPDPDLQSLYAEARQRGIFDNNPELQQLTAEAVKRGILTDLSGGSSYSAPTATPADTAQANLQADVRSGNITPSDVYASIADLPPTPTGMQRGNPQPVANSTGDNQFGPLTSAYNRIMDTLSAAVSAPNAPQPTLQPAGPPAKGQGPQNYAGSPDQPFPQVQPVPGRTPIAPQTPAERIAAGRDPMNALADVLGATNEAAGRAVAPVLRAPLNAVQGAIAPVLNDNAPSAPLDLLKSAYDAVMNNSGAQKIGAAVPDLRSGTPGGDLYNTLTEFGSTLPLVGLDRNLGSPLDDAAVNVRQSAQQAIEDSAARGRAAMTPPASDAIQPNALQQSQQVRAFAAKVAALDPDATMAVLKTPIYRSANGTWGPLPGKGMLPTTLAELGATAPPEAFHEALLKASRDFPYEPPAPSAPALDYGPSLRLPAKMTPWAGSAPIPTGQSIGSQIEAMNQGGASAAIDQAMARAAQNRTPTVSPVSQPIGSPLPEGIADALPHLPSAPAAAYEIGAALPGPADIRSSVVYVTPSGDVSATPAKDAAPYTISRLAQSAVAGNFPATTVRAAIAIASQGQRPSAATNVQAPAPVPVPPTTVPIPAAPQTPANPAPNAQAPVQAAAQMGPTTNAPAATTPQAAPVAQPQTQQPVSGYWDDTPKPFDPSTERNALLSPLSGQTSQMLPGVTREQTERYYARVDASNMAFRTQLYGLGSAKDVINAAASRGDQLIQHTGKTFLRAADGSTIRLPGPNSINYAQAVYNVGKFARNYGPPAETPVPQPSQPATTAAPAKPESAPETNVEKLNPAAETAVAEQKASETQPGAATHTFYVHKTDLSFEPIQGTPVKFDEPHENVSAFVHPSVGGDWYTITEGRTGTVIARGDTERLAIKSARVQMGRITSAQFQRLLDKHIAQYGEAPQVGASAPAALESKQEVPEENAGRTESTAATPEPLRQAGNVGAEGPAPEDVRGAGESGNAPTIRAGTPGESGRRDDRVRGGAPTDVRGSGGEGDEGLPGTPGERGGTGGTRRESRKPRSESASASPESVRPVEPVASAAQTTTSNNPVEAPETQSSRYEIEPKADDKAEALPVKREARVRDAVKATKTGVTTGDGENTGAISDPGEFAYPTGPNYTLTREDTELVSTATPSKKLQALLRAIGRLKALEAGSEMAGSEDQQILARFPGWGWTENLLNAANAANGWYKQLIGMLTKTELSAAIKATQNSHFTDPNIVRLMWQSVIDMGFDTGYVLEPSAGSGLFIGLMPEQNRAGSKIHGVELDDLTGRMLRQVYQGVRADIQGFETITTPDNTYDLAIGNVPFGNVAISDIKLDKRVKNSLLTRRIHNYFFARSLDRVRPGGVIAFITSHGTLDANDPVGKGVRAYLAEHAHFLGAIRLPNNAFASNAGTEVTTDIIYLRKRMAGETPSDTENKFGAVAQAIGPNGQPLTYTDGRPVMINEYFVAHPDMVIGTHSTAGKMYGHGAGGGQYTVESSGRDLIMEVADAMRSLPKDGYISRAEARAHQRGQAGMAAAERDANRLRVGAEAGVRAQALVVRSEKGKDGKVADRVFVNEGSDTSPVLAEVENLTAPQVQTIKAYTAVRDALGAVIDSQMQAKTAKAKDDTRAALKKAYDAFTVKNGPVHKKENQALINGDPDFYGVASLEDWDTVTKTVTGLAPIFDRDVINPAAKATTAKSIPDALAASLRDTGRMDVAHMATLLGTDRESVTQGLLDAGLAYHAPDGALVDRDAYGSGNVRAKLRAAEAAAAKDPETYAGNVAFLKTVQPPLLKASQIRVGLGARWVPGDTYRDFLRQIGLGANVMHSDATGNWGLDVRSYIDRTAATATFGTKRMNAATIFEKMINGASLAIYDKGEGDSRVLNVEETQAAQQKADAIRDRWNDWVMEDAERATLLTDIYNETINVYTERKYDGSHLTFPGQSGAPFGFDKNGKPRSMRAHQKNATWRIIVEQNNLLDQEVGTGKTAIMATAAMELRRMGLRNKPMILVLKSTIGGFAAEFKRLYPNARLLVANADNFDAGKRKEFMGRVATGDWDAVILWHQAFKLLSPSPDLVRSFYNSRIEELEAFIRKEQLVDKSSFTVKQAGKKVDQLQTRLKNMIDKLGEQQDNGVYWETLGVDQLIIDEAQAYKNLYVDSNYQDLQNDGNDATMDLLLKMEHLRGMNGGVTFATGTPVTNSPAEIHTLLRYLAPQLLQQQGIQHFDDWARQYVQMETVFEQDVAMRYREKARMVKLFNVPELVQLYRSIADQVRASDIPGLVRPDLVNAAGKVTNAPIIVECDSDDAMKVYFADMRSRASSGDLKKNPSLMLQISTDGRHVSQDARLRVPGAPYNPTGKVARVVQNVLKEYHDAENTKNKATQLVFIEIGQPGDGRPFDMFNEITTRLVSAGIPRKEICWIQDADKGGGDKDEKREVLFRALRTGEKRIMLGSRIKMGTGVNVQDRLVAIHQVDPLWGPHLFEQARGRMVRQGNMFSHVREYAYSTKTSFDGFMYSKMATKNDFIGQVTRAGDGTTREAEVGDETAASLDELRTIGFGDPRIKQWLELKNVLKKLDATRRIFQSEKVDLRNRRDSILKYTIPPQEILLKALNAAAAVRNRNPLVDNKFSGTVNGQTLGERKTFGQAVLLAADKMGFNAHERAIGSYRGFQIGVETKDAGRVNVSVTSPGWVSYDESRGIRKVIDAHIDASPVGLSQQIENFVNKIDGDIEFHQEQIQKNKAELPRIDAEMAKPWAKEAELEKARQTYAELDKIMATVLKEANAAQSKADRVTKGAEPESEIAAAPRRRPGAPLAGKPRVHPAPLPGGVAKDLAHIEVDLQAASGQKFQTGRPEQRGAAGSYNPSNARRVVRYAGDIDAMGHEIGHGLDDIYKLIAPWNVPRKRSPYDKELIPEFSQHGSSARTLAKRRQEAVAEWVTAWLKNPDEAVARAPKFAAHFEARVPAEVRARMQAASTKIRQYVGLPARERMTLNREWVKDLGRGTPFSERVSTLKSQWGSLSALGDWYDEHIRQPFILNVVDDKSPLRLAIREALRLRGLDGSKILPMDDIEMGVRLIAGVSHRALQMLESGIVFSDKSGEHALTKGGWAHVLEPIQEIGSDFDANYKNLAALLDAERAIYEGANGVQVITGTGKGLTADIDDALRALHESMNDANYPKLREAADRYRAWSSALLDYQVRGKYMSQEQADRIREENPYYVSFHRVGDAKNDFEAPRPNIRGAGVQAIGRLRQLIHRFKGGDQKMDDPFRIQIQQTIRTIAEVDRNMLVQQLRDLLVTPRKFYDGPVVELAAVGSASKEPGTKKRPAITVIDDGETTYLRFPTPIYDAIAGLAETDMPQTLGRIVGFSRNLVTQALLRNPGFALRHFQRSNIDRKIKSNVDSGIAAGFVPINEKELRDFRMYGGVTTGEFLLSKPGYDAYLTRKLAEMRGNPNRIIATAQSIGKGAHVAHEFLTQQAPRVEYRAAYKYAVEKKGYDHINAVRYAADQARSLVDPAIAGRMVRLLNKFVPFLSYKVAGERATFASFGTKKKAARTTWRLFCLGMAAALPIGWNAMMGKMEEYHQRPEWRKDATYGFYMAPNLWVEIPKGFPIEAVGSSFLERSFWAATGDKHAFDGFIAEPTKPLPTGTLPSALMPLDETVFSDGLGPIAEVMANYDFRYGSHIIPDEEHNLPLEDRPRIGEGSRMGAVLQNAIGVGGARMDARLWDHTIRSQLGGLGGAAINLSDLGRTDRPVHTATYVNDILGLTAEAPAGNAPAVQRVISESAAAGLPYSPLSHWPDANDPTKKSSLFQAVAAAVSDAQRAKAAERLRNVSEGPEVQNIIDLAVAKRDALNAVAPKSRDPEAKELRTSISRMVTSDVKKEDNEAADDGKAPDTMTPKQMAEEVRIASLKVRVVNLLVGQELSRIPANVAPSDRADLLKEARRDALDTVSDLTPAQLEAQLERLGGKK